MNQCFSCDMGVGDHTCGPIRAEQDRGLAWDSRASEGGSAFPFECSPLRNASDGMSLRDYFAGQALIANTSDNMLTLITKTADQQQPLIDGLAKACYQLADAMIKARAAQEPSR